MARQLLGLVAALLLAGLLAAQDRPQRGVIKKVDADKGIVTITVDGKDVDYKVIERTVLRDGENKEIADRLNDKRFKKGTPVMFKVRETTENILMGMRLGGPGGAGGGPGRRPDLSKARWLKDTSKLKPLTEMGTHLYEGQAGGLYPGGKNQRPEAHEAAGLRLAKQVQPLDRDGKPAKDGKIVLLSVGMSNTMQISNGLEQALRRATGINPRLVFVNGAQGGMTAEAIQSADGGRGKTYWDRVDELLKRAKVTRDQVQAVWIKQADAGPTEGFPDYPRKLQKEQANIVRLLHERFANLKLVYLSSRTYGGYATGQLNPEPYAYESGFGVKWLIEQQIKGDPALNFDPKKGPVEAPWLSWGPYLWANGMTRRADGFYSEKGDFAGDGTHHAAAGVRKMGEQVLKFFESDSTTKGWFLASGAKEG
jgi:hypothetical protein